jgi:hypothetical protein
MNQIYVVLKTYHPDYYSDKTFTDPVASFASFEAAQAHAKELSEKARKKNSYTETQYEVESVSFENI